MAQLTHYAYHADALSAPDTLTADGILWPASGADTLTEADMVNYVIGEMSRKSGCPADTIEMILFIWTDIPSGPDTDADKEAGQ